MFRLPGLCNSMCYFPAEQETKRVFVEANGFPGAGEGGKQSGRKETLYIDYFVVPVPAYLFQHAQQVAGLFLFIPYQYFSAGEGYSAKDFRCPFLRGSRSVSG